MKTIHLCLATILFSTSICQAQRLDGNAEHFLLRPEVVFRGQDAGVPLPPGAIIGAPSGTPNVGPQIQPSPAFSGPASVGLPQTTITAPPFSAAPVTQIPNATPVFQQQILPLGATVPPIPQSATPNGPVITPDVSTWNAFSPPIQQPLTDPFLTPGVPPTATPFAPNPFGIPPATGQGFSTFGANGPAPFRSGWQNNLELEWIPTAGTSSGAGGTFEQFGINHDLKYTGAFVPGWVFSWTNQFRFRAWDGPGGGVGLPGSAFRFGWDFAVETATAGPISWRFGITPSINTDFGSSLGEDAFQLDGRGIALLQLNQNWNLMLGAGFWDRVGGRVIPYVGFIYRDDFWEWQLTFPEAQIKLFLGNEALWSKWAYFRAEYHIEAYEVSLAGGGSDEVELEDIRLLLGFQMDAGTYSWFAEGGWVVDRDINFSLPQNTDFSANTSFIARVGWRY